MNSEDLRNRTMQFAVNIIQLYRKLPKSPEAQVIGRQLIRCATSVASNYRAAGKARSRREFVSKLSIVVEESDESLFWLELIQATRIESGKEHENLEKEARELTHIFSASRKSALENLNKMTNNKITKS